MRGVWREEREPGSPDANMAVDAALFEDVRCGRSLLPIVRVYEWDRPSVSFGRLQSEDAVREAFPNLPLVRRPTGGRAVLHGDDLTVSVITRTEWLPGATERGVLSSYRQIVGGLIAAFAAAGVEATLGGGACPRQRDAVDCFASIADCDAIDTRTGRKLMGSAQRRQDGAILQQMSIAHAFVPHLSHLSCHTREGLQIALGVDTWLFVDT